MYLQDSLFLTEHGHQLRLALWAYEVLVPSTTPGQKPESGWSKGQGWSLDEVSSETSGRHVSVALAEVSLRLQYVTEEAECG